jgi:probable HAF family extracellular repeat protein
MTINFQTVNFPNDTFTQLLGVNNADTIVGLHGTTNQGFSLTLPNTFTAENPPGATMTDVVGINNRGVSDGFFVDANNVTHGFVDDQGKFTTLDAPGTAFNQLLSINNGGQEAGYSSLDPAGQVNQLAYVRQANGTYTYLDNAAHTLNLPANANSQATGINNEGQVVGFFMPTSTTSDGFILDDGKLTVLQAPGSSFTQALGENNKGQVVGLFNDAKGATHGFVYSDGKYTTVDAPGATATTINGINDAGRIVGFDTVGANTNGITAKLHMADMKDTTTGKSWQQALSSYNGPVSGLSDELVDLTPRNINMSTTQANVFLHSGAGQDALQVSSGNNVLDGGTGSNFLTGGSGTDTFFVDARGATSDIWSTMANVHGGDAATVWGVNPKDFMLNWADGQGADAAKGLTLHATQAGKPTASLTLAGYSSSDLQNGRLSVNFGTDTASGSQYMSVHANS